MILYTKDGITIENLLGTKFRSSILFISNTIYNLPPVLLRKLKRVGSDMLQIETLKARVTKKQGKIRRISLERQQISESLKSITD